MTIVPPVKSRGGLEVTITDSGLITEPVHFDTNAAAWLCTSAIHRSSSSPPSKPSGRASTYTVGREVQRTVYEPQSSRATSLYAAMLKVLGTTRHWLSPVLAYVSRRYTPYPASVSDCSVVVGVPVIVKLPAASGRAVRPANCTSMPASASPLNWSSRVPDRRTEGAGSAGSSGAGGSGSSGAGAGSSVAGTVIVTASVAAPAAPAETTTLVVYVPGVMPPRAAESASVLLDRAASDPDVAPRASQPALSLAVQVRGLPPVFSSVTDALVPVAPKSTWSGATSRLAGWLAAGTVTDTDTASDPAPRAAEIWIAVEYVPGARLPSCAETETVREAPANIVPELAPRDSHPALSLALHSIARVPELTNVNDEVDASDPKSMRVGDTSSLEGFAASDSTSVGADEVHATMAIAQRAASAAGRTRTYMDCTANLQRGMCCRDGPGYVPGSAYWISGGAMNMPSPKTERHGEKSMKFGTRL